MVTLALQLFVFTNCATDIYKYIFLDMTTFHMSGFRKQILNVTNYLLEKLKRNNLNVLKCWERVPVEMLGIELQFILAFLSLSTILCVTGVWVINATTPLSKLMDNNAFHNNKR